MAISRTWWRLGWRFRHADKTFALAALGCLLVAGGVEGLSFFGVSVAAVESGWVQALFAGLAGLLGVASFLRS
jgi:hypothetical protein